MKETELAKYNGEIIDLYHENGDIWARAELRRKDENSPWFLLIPTEAEFNVVPPFELGTPFFLSAQNIDSLKLENGSLSMILPLRQVPGESGYSIG